MAEKLASRPTMFGNPAIPGGQRAVVVEPAKFSWDDPAQRNPAILLGVFTLLLIYAYWETLIGASKAWQQDLYSHGYIVPILAIGIMYVRRKAFEAVPTRERWIGLGILLASQLARIYWMGNYDMAPVDQMSFIGSMAGLFMLVGGWHLMKWAGPAVLFLIFMFPLPTVLETTLLSSLQRVASAASTIVLQTIGVTAFRDGNSIEIVGVAEKMEVAEACSGMRMLTIFGAMCVALVFFVDRPWWDKLIILLSIVPIALISNITRITITGLLFKTLPNTETVHWLVHDGAGYFMMVFGMGILWLLLTILSRLSVPEEEGTHMPMGGIGGKPRGTMPLG